MTYATAIATTVIPTAVTPTRITSEDLLYFFPMVATDLRDQT